MGRYDDKSPKEALDMSRSRIRRAWGHAAVFAWSGLNLDRGSKQLAVTRRLRHACGWRHRS